ncbi:MAG TPA: DUF2306 domain-containing protein [Saprospiraceae bacterium]|nr:DUF2306 domain-containing protein [Saprospiraceae bacterium]
MEFINLIHTLFSVIALLAGAWVLLQTKGTRQHILIGRVYGISMLVLIFTSFFIFDLFGSFGAFHVLAIVSLVTLCLGMYFPLFARNNRAWLVHHYMWMSYSYVGLVMAGGSHLFALVPDWPGWLSAGLFWGLPYFWGSILIFRNRKRILTEVKDREDLDIQIS